MSRETNVRKKPIIPLQPLEGIHGHVMQSALIGQVVDAGAWVWSHRGRSMLKNIIGTAVVGIALCTGTPCAQTTIPDLHIELSFRQSEEGHLSQGIHLLHLWCSDGRCDLTILTLNECVAERFSPTVEWDSNMILAGKHEGTLQVKSRGEGLLHLEQNLLGEGKITYDLRFREAQTDAEKSQTRNSLLTRQGLKKIVLTEFKGNVTKYSAILEKVVSVEYVPLTEEYITVNLDCSALIPGTPSLKKQE